MQMINPTPYGWKYGFPKVFDNNNGRTIEEWLVDNGYPVDKYPEFRIRMWDIEGEVFDF